MCCPWYSRALIPVHIFNLIGLLLHAVAFVLPAISVKDDVWRGMLLVCEPFDFKTITDDCIVRDILGTYKAWEDWEKAAVFLAMIGIIMYLTLFITLVSTCCRCGHSMCTVVLAIFFCVFTIGCSAYPAISYWVVDGFEESYSLAMFVAAAGVQVFTLLLLFISGCFLKADR